VIYPGIDLGTTYSMIAHVNAHGQPALFPDVYNANFFRTPSVVYIGREGCLVGAAAEELLEDAPALPVMRFVKARLGQSGWAYTDHQKRQWTAEALSALIVKKLLNDADTFANDDLGPAVITVPAQFTDEQRRAVLSAADLAGLGNIKLVEEPVAAATYFGLGAKTGEQTFLVYDFGGGTFDVSIVQTAKEGLYVLATDGISQLGGRFLDEQVMEFIASDYRQRTGRSPLDDPGAAQRLRRLAEDSKIKMSKPAMPQVKQSLLLLGEAYDFVFTRQQFDTIALAAVRKTLAACERCLSAASLTWKDIDKILLIGGSSLLPQVTVEILRMSGKSTRDLISKQPHQAVAFGAAILAQQLNRDTSTDGAIRQVAGADLCLRIWDRQKKQMGLETLISRNTPLPAAYSRTFFTSRDDQTRVVLEFVQRRGDPAEEFSLGHFAFGPLDNPRRNYPIEVTVALGRDGLVRITARDQVMGTEMAYALEESSQRRRTANEEQRRLVESVVVNG